jgi:hypothetical protein
MRISLQPQTFDVWGLLLMGRTNLLLCFSQWWLQDRLNERLVDLLHPAGPLREVWVYPGDDVELDWRVCWVFDAGGKGSSRAYESVDEARAELPAEVAALLDKLNEEDLSVT